MRNKFEADGVVWLRNALSSSELDQLDEVCDLDTKAGVRLNISDCLQRIFVSNSLINSQLNQLIPNTQPVRTVYFNKSNEGNWAVPWHQDRVISVKEPYEIEGYKNWSQKNGVWHCEPPLQILDKMLFVRIHLDDSHEENGAMEIAVGSHKEGFVSSEQAKHIAGHYEKQICTAKRGDILVLKMLTLHRSLASQSSSLRRTLRIDLADDILPEPLSFSS